MQHFIILLTYTASLAEVDRALDAHRHFLDEHFAAGTFLLSGPQVPRRGGVILARAPTRGDIERIVDADPFRSAGVARYDVIEFAPTKFSATSDLARAFGG